MEHSAGIDVSLECSSVRVVDGSKIVRETKVASEPAALIGWQNDLVVVGIDVAKDKADAGMRPLALRQARVAAIAASESA